MFLIFTYFRIFNKIISNGCRNIVTIQTSCIYRLFSLHAADRFSLKAREKAINVAWFSCMFFWISFRPQFN